MRPVSCGNGACFRICPAIAAIVLTVTLFGCSSGASAQPAIIHVYQSGDSRYVGSAGLKRAIADAADPGAIYVHTGTYDLGATDDSFLTISKGLSLVGYDDGTGRPMIRGARPSGNVGLVLVNAPDKEVSLVNLELSFYGKRGITTDTTVLDQASNSFTVKDCEISGAYFDDTLGVNQGLYAAIVIRGIPRSEFSDKPGYVKGKVRILDSTLTSMISGMVIGYSGPVSLDAVEVSNCVINSLGSNRYADGNRGNFGIMILQYPIYMTDENRSSLIEATHAGTQITITNNTVTASNTLYLLYLKGLQLVQKNRFYAASAWFDPGGGGGKYFQSGIVAAGYPHDPSDPATYSEALIEDNVIDLRVPPFPLSASQNRPQQTRENSFPVTAIWLGMGPGFAYRSSAITGHYAKAAITGNIISSRGYPVPYQMNDPDYGIYLTNEMKDCLVSGNILAGGQLRDPIDGRIRPFNALTAGISQLHIDAGGHKNKILRNAFGYAGVAGIRCQGYDNLFEGNQFFGGYPGWDPGPGLFWMTTTSHGNRIVSTKLNDQLDVSSLCGQIRDETATSLSPYDGLNIIQGLIKCRN